MRDRKYITAQDASRLVFIAQQPGHPRREELMQTMGAEARDIARALLGKRASVCAANAAKELRRTIASWRSRAM